MTERFPNLAPGLFKHISDIGDMERRFGGLAWRLYDESFRREKKAHHLDFGQIHWDLRFRCLQQSTQAGRPPFRSPNTRSPIVGSVPSRTGRYTGGQCFSFERSVSCSKPASPYKHSCARCSGVTRPATVAVNPPLPKVIVSPSSHTLPTPSKGTCSRHTCCIMMNMNQQSLSQGSLWGFPFTTMAQLTHAPPEIIGLLSRLLL